MGAWNEGTPDESGYGRRMQTLIKLASLVPALYAAYMFVRTIVMDVGAMRKAAAATTAEAWWRSPLATLALLVILAWVPIGIVYFDPNAFQGQPIDLQRRLPDDQKNKLARELATLASLTKSLAVIDVNGDVETERLQHDFADALRRAGIAPLFGWTTPDGPDQVGIFVIVKNINAPPFIAAKLQEALKSINMTADIVPFPRVGVEGAQLGNSEVAIYVAPRPL